MLRWCLPTVRVSGGPGNALFNFVRVRASSAYRCALKLSNNIDNDEVVLPHSFGIDAATICERPSLSQVAYNSGEEAVLSITSFSVEPSSGEPCLFQSEIRATRIKRPHEPELVVAVHAEGGRRTSCEEGPRNEDKSHGSNDLPLSSVSKLKSFLSPAHFKDHSSAILNATTVRSLYLSTKARSQTHELTALDMSALISLFGTLSLSTSEHLFCGLFTHPLVSSMPRASRERSYWPFVAQLAKDKHRLFDSFTHSDHYWIMLAQLAEAEALDRSDLVNAMDRRLKKAMAGAKAHYMHVGRFSRHPNIHVPYLQALLRRPTMSRLNEAAESLCRWMNLHHSLPPRLWDMFWKILLHHDLQACSRNKVIGSLRALARRRESAVSTDGASTESPARRQQHSCRVGKEVDYTYIGELPKALAQATSCSATLVRGSPDVDAVFDWARYVVQSVLTSDQFDTDDVFKRLALLDAVRHRKVGTASQNMLTATSGSILHGQQMDWEVTCILTVLENLLHDDSGRIFAPLSSGGIDPNHLLKIGNMLWESWSSSPSHVSHEPLIPSLIIASFLYIAGRTRDYNLVRACSTCIGPMLARNEGNPSHQMATRYSMVEYILSNIACGHNLGAVFRMVKGYVRDQDLVSVIFDDVIKRITKTEPILASEAVVLAGSMEVSVSAEVVFSVGANFSAHGHVYHALQHVQDKRLNLTQQCRLFKSVLSSLNRFPSPTSHFNHILTFIRNLSPSHVLMRFVCKTLQHLLLGLAMHGDSAQAVRIIRYLHVADPAYLPRSFLLKIRRRLVFRRHFHLARSLSQYCLRGLEPRSLITKRDNKIVGSRELNVVTGSDLPRQGSKTEMSSPESLTLAGNKLLHRHLLSKASRHMRRMKRMLAVFRELVTKRGFVPSRITTNILMKGLLRWPKQVDDYMVRALFDRMVQNGYPTGGLYPAGIGPFGCEVSISESTLPLSEVKSPISFRKHVRPLYKMFIRAMSVRADFSGARVVSDILRALNVQYVKECRAVERRGRRRSTRTDPRMY